MSILRVDHSSSATPSSIDLSKVVYHDENDCSAPGRSNIAVAAYIAHLGFMEDSTTGGQLFGLTSSHNHQGNEVAFSSYVFRVKLDPVTGAIPAVATGDSDYEILRLDESDLHEKSILLGMRPAMELDGSNYYVHLIYYKHDKKTYYLRASPSVVETVKA